MEQLPVPTLTSHLRHAARGMALAAALCGGAVADLAAAAPPDRHVDAVAGDDGAAGSEAAPFRTLARALRAPLDAGLHIRLRCGRVWREPLHLSAAAAANGLSIAGYGPDCATAPATLSGADDFSQGWTRDGNVWSRQLPAATPAISQLFIGGVPHHIAQWPDAGSAVLTAAPADAAMASASASASASGSGSGSAAQALRLSAGDAAALRNRDVAGATVHVRSLPWLVESHTVGSIDGQRSALTLSAGRLRFEARAGAAVVLQGKRWMLDAPGEFLHDTAASRLYVMPRADLASADLNTLLVEGSVRDTPLLLRGVRGVSVTDVAAVRGRRDGVVVIDAPGTLLQRLHARWHGGAGIFIAQWTPRDDPAVAAPVVRQSTVEDNAERGIDAAQADGVQIVGNTVARTGLGEHVGPVLAAVLAGPGAVVENNVIDGAAYNGVSFSSLAGTRVAGNRVSHYCIRLSDCAAIYAWHGSAGAAAADQRSVVEHNVVLAASLSDGGTGGGSEVLAGVYLDDFVRGAVVRDNLLFGMPQGIFLHNAGGNEILNNRIWLPGEVALWLSVDQLLPAGFGSNLLAGNDVVLANRASGSLPAAPRLQTVHAVRHWVSGQPAAAPAVAADDFQRNRVRALTGASAEHAWLSDAGVQRRVDAAQWKALHPADGDVAAQPLLSPSALQLGPELVAAGGLAAGRWQPWFSPGSSGHARAGTAADGCSAAPCMALASDNDGDLLFSPDLTLVAGALYRLAYSAVLQTAGAIGAPYVSRAGPPWDSVADGTGYASTSLRRRPGPGLLHQEAFFVARTDAPSRVNLQLQRGTTAAFRDVSLRRVLAYSVQPTADWSRLVLAPDASARTVFGCQDLGWTAGCRAVDVAGQPVAWPMTVAAGQALLLLRLTDGAAAP